MLCSYIGLKLEVHCLCRLFNFNFKNLLHRSVVIRISSSSVNFSVMLSLYQLGNMSLLKLEFIELYTINLQLAVCNGNITIIVHESGFISSTNQRTLARHILFIQKQYEDAIKTEFLSRASESHLSRVDQFERRNGCVITGQICDKRHILSFFYETPTLNTPTIILCDFQTKEPLTASVDRLSTSIGCL